MDAKVKLMLDESVTNALAEIQDADTYENYKSGLEAINDFIFKHSDFDKTTVVCLSAVHDLGKLLAQLNGQSRT